MPGAGLAAKMNGIAFQNFILGVKPANLGLALLIMGTIAAISTIALYFLSKSDNE